MTIIAKAMRLGRMLSLLALSGCGLFVDRLPSGQIPEPSLFDRFVEIEGVNYHYREYPGEGRDVFLLHGFASSTYTWHKVAPLLQAKGYHVWALDLKGFGWSDKPRQAAYDATALMEDVERFLNAEGLKGTVFVGSSYGGRIGWMMALYHPERVERLVLVDASAYPMERPFIVRLMRSSMGAFLSRLFFGKWIVRSNLEEVYYDDEKVTEDVVDAYYDRLRTDGALEAQSALARAIDDERSVEAVGRIPEIRTKTLILWGAEDRWIPLEHGYRFRREIPGSTLVVIPDCGHVPQEEMPDVTARAILELIEGKEVGGAAAPDEPEQTQQP